MSAPFRKEAEDIAGRYPALLTEARRIAANVVHGVHGRRQAGAGETFWQFRHAAPSDPSTRIDWRRSARSDDLYVRETEWEAANTLLFWRDGGAGMDWSSHRDLPRKKDRAAVLLMALAISLLKGGERCHVPGISMRPGSGMAAIERISQELILHEVDFNALLQDRPMRHARLIMASDFLEGPQIWEDRFTRMAARGLPVTLLHILDPQEADFRYLAHTRFHAGHGQGALDLGRPQSVQTAYQQKFNENREAIRQLATQRGWSFFSHRTDHAPGDVFLAMYSLLQQGAAAR